MHICGDAGVELATIPTYAAPYCLVPPHFTIWGLLLLLVLLVWTGKAGKKLSMHVCVAQAPVGSIDWSVNEQSVSKQTGPNGAIWPDDLQTVNLMAKLLSDLSE